jgi:hypothetical protein
VQPAALVSFDASYVFEYAVRLYSISSVEIFPRVVTRDLSRPVSHTVIISIETWIPLSRQVLYAFLVECHRLLVKPVLQTRCTSCTECLVHENYGNGRSNSA